MKMLRCDRCLEEMDENWHPLLGNKTKTGGSCTTCGEDLCPDCSGGFDKKGECERCRVTRTRSFKIQSWQDHLAYAAEKLRSQNVGKKFPAQREVLSLAIIDTIIKEFK